ncbi:hypothetical protein E2C01_083381 [Portunus trituberculatus]|uniref:Uncharacterized protein n=1 Tax=Portunus trituberculatus TaxID=210409 RepID=A0A5B7J3C2_PORTR|nr:hypothetical protein [Portunus trituberculatus]
MQGEWQVIKTTKPLWAGDGWERRPKRPQPLGVPLASCDTTLSHRRILPLSRRLSTPQEGQTWDIITFITSDKKYTNSSHNWWWGCTGEGILIYGPGSEYSLGDKREEVAVR